MAETLTVTLQVKDEQAKKKLEDFAKSLEKTGKKAGESAKDAKKDWQGLGELFTGLLPRNMQGLLRSFKSTQRGVKGVSKSFKALKAAWASIGIGLIIIALEELVANWDAISDAVGLTSEEQRRNEKVAKSQAQAYADLNSQTRGYIAVLEDQFATEESVAGAVDALNKSLGNVIDKEATREEQLQQAKTALEAKQKAEQQEIKVRELQAAMLEDELTLHEDLQDARVYIGRFGEWTAQSERNIKKRLKASEDLKKELEEETKLLAEQTQAFRDLQDEAGQRAADAREAEKRAKESEALARRNAETRKKILADLAIYEEELLLQGEENAEKLEVLRAKRRQKAEMEQAKDARLSQEGLERLAKRHQEELDAIEKEYADQRAEEQKADEERLNEAEMTQQERQIAAVKSRYDELITLAEKYGRDTTKLEAQRQAELDKIQRQGADKEIKEITAMYELERELQLLSMDERTAEYEKQRDDANAMSRDRMAIAQAGYEKEKEQLIAQGLDTTELENQHAMLMKQIRQQLADDLVTIDKAESQSFVDSRREMIEGALDFADTVGGVLQEMQAYRDAETEAAIIEAKIRGATDEEIAQIEAEAAERERRFAVGQVLLAQGMAMANAIAGASQAAAATGPGAPFALVAYLGTMVGSIIAGFAQVKSIMNEAEAENIPTPSEGGVGGAQRGITQALDPNLATDFSNEYTGEGGAPDPFKAYVVLSDIQGQQADYDTISSNASL